MVYLVSSQPLEKESSQPEKILSEPYHLPFFDNPRDNLVNSLVNSLRFGQKVLIFLKIDNLQEEIKGRHTQQEEKKDNWKSQLEFFS